jgi:hypothetical protein
LKRTTCGLAAVLIPLLVFATSTRAQSGSVYFGGGTASDSSAGPIDTLGAGITYTTPRMGGFFDTVGGDVIFFHHLGVGAEVSFRNSKGPYAGLQYHPSFYDINAVYQPAISSQRFVPEIQGGVGRASIGLYYTPQFCATFSEGCRSTTAEVSSESHLELHFAGGLRYYFYKGAFVRPQVDVRWVHNILYFGSSWVPEYTVSIGYTVRRNH